MSHRRTPLIGALVVFAVMVACSKRDPVAPEPPPPPPPGSQEVRLERVTDQLQVPVFLTAPPGDTRRLFVVEKLARVRIIKDGSLLPTPFLDLSEQTAQGYEQGLLGLAFDPNYAVNRRFYICYTEPGGDAIVSRYQVSVGDPDVAEPAPDEAEVLRIDHPDNYDNHNGGMLAFGPDGMLYLSHGDGGGSGDPLRSGQNPNDLLGNILRIDVSSGSSYSSPSDNPFFNRPPARPEVWCYGLRNPWRFSFDRQNGDLYIADVGQDALEEVDVATAAGGRGKGLNFGWSTLEAGVCFGTVDCNPAGLTLPVMVYPHSQGCSITGGYVYRGGNLPWLRGTYFYADYCNGQVRSFRYQGGIATEARSWPELSPAGRVTSFGEDGGGELYVMTEGGSLHRFARAPTMAAAAPSPFAARPRPR
jgi:glucose/arabinose dehydrogenase